MHAAQRSFDHGHRTFPGFHGRWQDFPGQPGLVVVEETTMLDDLLRDWVESLGEFSEWNFFAATDTFDQAEIGRSQQPDVLRVLAVDLFNALAITN